MTTFNDPVLKDEIIEKIQEFLRLKNHSYRWNIEGKQINEQIVTNIGLEKSKLEEIRNKLSSWDGYQEMISVLEKAKRDLLSSFSVLEKLLINPDGITSFKDDMRDPIIWELESITYRVIVGEQKIADTPTAFNFISRHVLTKHDYDVIKDILRSTKEELEQQEFTSFLAFIDFFESTIINPLEKLRTRS